ncbi:MAG: HD domain-containing protein [Planctomycetaceae bacterium]|nr:HD domain-containing protein [Planctomycetaceae bacterium]
MITTLSDLEPEQEADAFVLLTEKQLITPKSGKPFFSVVFRDANREIPSVPIWADSPLYGECQKNWEPGKYYKIRTKLRVTEKYGKQLEIHRIRETMPSDKQDGFDPVLCRPSSQVSPEAMYEELLALAKKHIGKGKLLNLITLVFKDYRHAIQETAAARNYHHAFVGGLLEHTLNVTKTAVFLADHYLVAYPKLPVPFSKPLVVAGAILHDIGKIRELQTDAISSHHTTEGDLIGHAVLGRDFVRDYGKLVELEPQVQTHLEHIVLTHARFPDWGAPKPPMSLETLLVHSADYCDALFGSYVNVFLQDETVGEITSSKNRLGHALYRGNEQTLPKPKTP